MLVRRFWSFAFAAASINAVAIAASCDGDDHDSAAESLDAATDVMDAFTAPTDVGIAEAGSTCHIDVDPVNPGPPSVWCRFPDAGEAGTVIDGGALCFTSDSIHQVTPAAPPFRVLRFASSVLLSNVPNPRSFPSTGAFSYPSEVGESTQPHSESWEYFWVDRGFGANAGDYTATFAGWKPNQWPQSSLDVKKIDAGPDGGAVLCGPTFSTFLKAIGSSAIRMMWSLGYAPRNDPDAAPLAAVLKSALGVTTSTANPGWLDVADAFGFDTSGWAPYLSNPTDLYTDTPIDTGAISHFAYVNANLDSLCTPMPPELPAPPSSGYLPENVRGVLDRVVLAKMRAVDMPTTSPIRGEYLDFEFDDHRGPDLVVGTVKVLSAITRLKCVGLVIGPDALASADQPDGGPANYLDITPSIGPTLLDLVSGFGIQAARQNGICGLDGGEQAFLQCSVDTLFKANAASAVDTSKIFLQVDPTHFKTIDAPGARSFIEQCGASGVLIMAATGTDGTCDVSRDGGVFPNETTKIVLGIP